MRRALATAILPVLLLAAGCGGDGDGDDAAGGGDFCDQATDFDAQVEELDRALGGSGLPTSDQFTSVADALEELAADAPDEIDQDVETLAGGVRQIGEVFADLDPDAPEAEVLAELERISAELEDVSEDLEAASERVGDHLEDECGIDIDATSSDAPDTTEATEE